MIFQGLGRDPVARFSGRTASYLWAGSACARWGQINPAPSVTKAFVAVGYVPRHGPDQEGGTTRRYSAGEAGWTGGASATTSGFAGSGGASAVGLGGFLGGGTDSRRVSAYSVI